MSLYSETAEKIRVFSPYDILISMKHRSRRNLCLLFLCVLAAGLVSGCAEMRPADAVEAYDVQAANSAAGHWYPLTLETVVIAIDRSRTDMAVATWSDLYAADVSVSLPNDVPVQRRLTGAALCYGLEGDDFGLEAAARLLKSLSRSGRLEFDDDAAPIQICFDSDAAARIRKGEDVEIVVPAEGTLTYVKGLLSEQPLDLPEGYKRALLDSGLRLTDGRCDETIYPPPESYAPAASLTDDPLLLTRVNTVTQGWRRMMNRQIQHIWLYSGADLREDVLFAVLVLVVAAIWVESMMRRCQQENIRRVIFILSLFLIGWIFIRYWKWQIDDETTLGRYLWFSYYQFEMILALGLLRIASLIGTGSGDKGAPKWFGALCAYSLILGGLILTNDLHGLMFRLDLSQAGWSSTGVYGYGPIYFLFTATILAELIGGIVLMFIKVKHSPLRFGFIAPLVFTAVLVTYIVGYDRNIPFFAKSDITLVLCLFALIFMELCIRTGQMPVNTHYRVLFQNAGLNLQITDGAGSSVIASKDAESLSKDQWSALDGKDAVQEGENTLIRKNKVSGGFAVWREDVSAVNRLQKDIEISNREIETANALLSGEARSKEQAARNHTRLALYNVFEKDIAPHEKRLAELLAGTSSDHVKYDESMKKAAIITCYIKRRSYFLSMVLEDKTSVPYHEFVVYIDEMAELARLAGVLCLTYCSLTDKIRLSQAMLFYDFWASLLEWAVSGYSDGIILQTIVEDGWVIMRLRASDAALRYALPDDVAVKAGAEGGVYEKTSDAENLAVLRLSFPAEGLPPEGGEGDA